ncbi:LytR family transcriptional regulator [Streptomyces alfalfae]|uniref:Transcriptional regulator n=1 Tax=Streptomyces alfalfae TaxID=1642299 RepID=A0ABM6GQM0_9ACTN|nr:LCP family protein [Streptomyces alfalfae]AYA16731.1 LytR family transcriptional regulator [Streptomyces fradiae]APY86350.1 transcriptional regulator [Streptomyces alfalfae]QUI33891.1 LCP family protein [Streptomyces alfalfae]RXX44429.1 LytR family transcriptional regulator [Streptomyces alfalfae]RZM90795.1 LytR family transcriptional regulator [Streptomyces alfalfae]
MTDESRTPDAPRRGKRGRRRKPPSKRKKALVVTAWTAAGVVVLGGTGLGFVYFKLNGNIQGVDINAALGADRPADVDNGSQDILVLGSDSRSGDNAKYGKDEGAARSDTAMIVHVYKGHKKASIVSIPRDTLISRPDCTAEDGEDAPGAERQMFNSAYEVGGPACAVKTVEKMSGIRMDHYIEVDFSGFKKLIDTLGGVDITTKKAIRDKDSHLDLDAGTHRLTGEQALGLVRTRHGVGDGSDLGRIQLQQAFIKALLDQVKDVGVFGNPKKLFDLADDATSAITTDSDLNDVKSLAGFAGGLKGIGADDMKMVTMPIQYDPADPNRVLPLEEADQQVWDALKADKAIPRSATEKSAGDKGDVGDVVSSE